MLKVTCASSNGVVLVFTKDEYDDYSKDLLELQMKHYGRVRYKHGIWASNQNKFVRSVDDLNSLDSQYMEKQYAFYSGFN